MNAEKTYEEERYRPEPPSDHLPAKQLSPNDDIQLALGTLTLPTTFVTTKSLTKVQFSLSLQETRSEFDAQSRTSQTHRYSFLRTSLDDRDEEELNEDSI